MSTSARLTDRTPRASTNELTSRSKKGNTKNRSPRQAIQSTDSIILSGDDVPNGVSLRKLTEPGSEPVPNAKKPKRNSFASISASNLPPELPPNKSARKLTEKESEQLLPQAKSKRNSSVSTENSSPSAHGSLRNPSEILAAIDETTPLKKKKIKTDPSPGSSALSPRETLTPRAQSKDHMDSFSNKKYTTGSTVRTVLGLLLRTLFVDIGRPPLSLSLYLSAFAIGDPATSPAGYRQRNGSGSAGQGRL